MIGLLDFFALRGLKLGPQDKLVRHQQAKYPARELLLNGWLGVYQGYQSRRVFHKAKRVAAFAGGFGTTATLFGVFDVRGFTSAANGPLPQGCPYAAQWQRECQYFYDLAELADYRDLNGRLVIDWGKGAKSWHQRPRNKAIRELLPEGRLLPRFESYLSFSLTYQELCHLVRNRAAHQDWHGPLAAVGGIYLIVAESTGQQYIGSASGIGGIWRRWEDYESSGDGGNAALKQIIAKNPSDFPRGLRFSVLHHFSSGTTTAVAVQIEELYKKKLGSRVIGLNRN
ncbi:MAG TPA: GIY-YIG nuclease family protein [Terriglobia bacterium]|nr:GIY-YIG nuclease family protein [Terriglobia bacterium]